MVRTVVSFAAEPPVSKKTRFRWAGAISACLAANWAAGGSVNEMFKLIRSHKPAQENPAPSPFEWGKTARVLELLGGHFDVEFEVGTSFFQPESAEHAVATFPTGF